MVKNMKVEKFEKFPNQEQARFLITSVVTVKVINRMRAMDTFGRFSTKNVLTYCVRIDLGKHMPPDFVKDVIDAFSKIKEEIDEKRGELDFRHSLAICFLKNVLGWGRKKGEGHYEIREREDIRLFDGQNRCVALIETKNPRIARLTDAHRSELKEHLDDYKGMAQYGALTNGHELKLFEYTTEGELNELASIDIDAFAGKGAEALSKTERQKVHLLRRLRRDRFVAVSPEYFRKTAQTIKIEEPRNFDLFIEDLRGSLDELTRVVYERFFKFYWEAGPNHYGGKFLREEAFPRWKGASTGKEEELEEKFCQETAYVILNRILFTRILEDKEIVKRMISGEEFTQSLRMFGEGAYEAALKQAYKNVEKFYAHFYEFGIFDWWRLPEDKLGMLTEDEKRIQKEIEDEFNTVVVRDILKRLNQFDFRKVGRDILGDVYQEYLPPAERKRLGEFYTPVEVVRYILDAVGYTPENRIEDKLLLDPACGSGTFLVEAAKQLAKRYEEKLKYPLQPDNAKTIIEGIVNNIQGLDINPFACHIAEMNMLFNIIDYLHAVHNKYREYRLPRFNICSTDSLMPPEMEAAPITEYITNGRIRSHMEEAKRARGIKKKQFDFVVGNPPWGGILKREKGTLLAEKLKENYVSAVGKYDIYVLFIERGINWLKSDGRFGYITQNRFLRADYGKKLREYLLENVKIEKIVDFGDTKVFADATNYPAITILQKTPVKENEIIYLEVNPKANELSAEEVIRFVKSYPPKSKDYISIMRINQQKLKNLNAWIPAQIFIDSIISKIKNIKKLGDITEEIMEGVTFGGKGSDNIYCVDEKTVRNFRIETNAFKKVLKGRDIRKWNLEWDGRFLLYPYDSSGNEINIKEYPNCCEYLKQFQNELSRRVLDGKKITEWGKQWFSFWRPRSPRVFEKEKILSPRLSTSNSFALDAKGEFYLTDSAVAIVPKNVEMKYLLGVLNSNLLFFIVKHTSPFVQGRYYSYTRTYLEKLPIKLPQTSKEKRLADQIMKKVDTISKHGKQLDELEEKIKKFPESYFVGEKLVNAAEECKLSKAKYDMKSLVIVKKAGEELYKLALTKDDYVLFSSQAVAECALEQLKRRDKVRIEEINGLKVPSKKDAAKIMDEFSSDKKKVEKIRKEVEKLEGEIDELVYELYGLDAKDREVIEKFLKRF